MRYQQTPRKEKDSLLLGKIFISFRSCRITRYCGDKKMYSGSLSYKYRTKRSRLDDIE